MNRLKKGLLGLGLAGLLTVSGCTGFTLGGMEPIDRRNSAFGGLSDVYANEALLKAELDDSLELTDYFMSRGRYDEAGKVIERTFREKGFQDGLRCLDQTEKYAQKFNIKAKEIDDLINKYKVDKKGE